MKLARKDRSASTILSVFNLMVDLREKWNDLWELPYNMDEWDKDQRMLADFVCAQLQQGAYLVAAGAGMEKRFIENYASVYFKSWLILEDFVKDNRKHDEQVPGIKRCLFSKDKGAFSRVQFEKLAIKSGKYLKRKHPSYYAAIVTRKGRGKRFSQLSQESK